MSIYICYKARGNYFNYRYVRDTNLAISKDKPVILTIPSTTILNTTSVQPYNVINTDKTNENNFIIDNVSAPVPIF